MDLRLKTYIDKHLFGVETVIYALVAGAILMIAADKLGPKNPKVKHWIKLLIDKHLQLDLSNVCRCGQDFLAQVQQFRVVCSSA